MSLSKLIPAEISSRMNGCMQEVTMYHYAGAAAVSTMLLYSIVRSYYKRKFSYWRDRRISGPEPRIPGGTSQAAEDEDFLTGEVNRVKKYGRIFGAYDGTQPVLVISDPVVLQDCLVTGFDSFPAMLSSSHPVQSRSLVETNGHRWNEMRDLMNPIFSADALKGMHSAMKHVIGDLVRHMDKRIASGDTMMECMKLFSNYSMDVLAKLAFSMECNSNESRYENAIVRNVQKFFNISKFKLLLEQILPSFVQRMIGFSFANSEAVSWLVSEAKRILVERRANIKNGMKFSDLLQAMIDADIVKKDGRKEKLQEVELIANIFVFLLAGPQSTSLVLACASYLLAQHPEVQQRLRQEVEQAVAADRGQLKHDTIMSLEYLNAVACETMRLYPPVTLTEKICVKDYHIKSLGITMTKGSKVNYPIYAIHHLDQHYPVPEKFDPDRFMPENEGKRVPFTFLPFLTGPRECLGTRFAMLKIMTTLAAIVLKYDIATCEGTRMDLSRSSIFLDPKEVVVRFTKRKDHGDLVDDSMKQSS